MEPHKNGANGQYKPETVEYAGATTTTTHQAKPSFGQRVKAHYKKWWWAHLLNFAVCTLVITLCLVFVGFPNIAQGKLNGATIELLSQDVTNPTLESVQLQMVTEVESHTSYKPTIDAFNAALFLESTMPDIKPFAHITIPSQKTSKKYNVTVSQRMFIEDMEQFIAYNTVVLSSEEYRVAIRGQPDLHQPGLPKTDVAFNKVVTSKGLNKMQGLEIRDMKLSITPGPDGANMHGTAYIPNPSPMTLFLGNISQNLFVDGQPIGYSYIDNMLLKPGDNFFPLRSITNQSAVITLITTKYKDAVVPMEIRGNSSVVNGQLLPYFTAALQNVPINVKLSLGPALKDLGLKLPGL